MCHCTRCKLPSSRFYLTLEELFFTGQNGINEPDSLVQMLAVAFCDGFHLEGVHFANSPAKHVTVFRSQWVTINGISVSSPGDSPNTDGLLIQESKHVQVISSNFASGADFLPLAV